MQGLPLTWSVLLTQMICICLVPIHFWSEFSLALDSSDTKSVMGIELTQTILGLNRLRLQCEVRGENIVDNLIILHCPVTKTRICLQNCLDPCKRDVSCGREQISPVQDCKHTTLSADYVKVEYDLQLEATHRKGQWWCIARGQESNRVVLEYKELSNVGDKNPAQEGSNANQVINKNSTTHQIHMANPITETIFFRGFSREVVILLVVVTALSVVLNLILFIRCHVEQNYLKQVYTGHATRTWIDNLCCISIRKRRRLRGDAFRVDPFQRLVDWKAGQVGHSISGLPVLPWTAPCTPLAYRKIAPPFNTPMHLQNMTDIPEKAVMSSKELVYDEVPDSVYKGSECGQPSPQTLVKTPDGQSWILDHRGRVYLPYGQVSQSGSIEIPRYSADDKSTTAVAMRLRENVNTPVQGGKSQNQPTYAQYRCEPLLPQPTPRGRPPFSPGQILSADVENDCSMSNSGFDLIDAGSPRSLRLAMTLAALSEETSTLLLDKSCDLVPGPTATISEINFSGDQTPFPWCDSSPNAKMEKMEDARDLHAR